MDSTVVVTGVGTEPVVPDVVHLALGVELARPTPADALAAAGEALRDLHAVLDAGGVPAGARQTSGTTVRPAWEGERYEGHVATAGLDLRLADVEAAGGLVQRVADAAGEALQVRALHLGAGDLRAPTARARAAAVRDARERATQIAAAAALRLGEVVSLVEGGAASDGPRYALAASSGAEISPGESEVAVTVTGTWRLLPLT